MTAYVFQHIRKTQNIGDRVTTPARWFDFGPDVTKQHFGQPLPDADVAVFGGGQVYMQAYAAMLASAHIRHRVTWAVGMQGRAQSLQHDILQGALSVMGCRDVGIPGTVYVPCPSCMTGAFDAPAPPKHAVVLYFHADKSDALQTPQGIPALSNMGGRLAEKLAFIASGATVVSNSFHGVYWAMLMGRRVLALPFSHKFNGYSRMPAIADASDWLGDLPRAHALPGYRDECRTANRAFHDRVLNLTP